MRTNYENFRIRVLSFDTKNRTLAKRVTQGFLFTTCRAIVTKEGVWGPGTPIRSGFAASSWRAGVGALPVTPHDVKTDGIGPLAEFTELLRVEPGDQVFLGSACEYMPELEHGHSGQAPEGMMTVVIAQGQRIMDSVVVQVAHG